ncbi:MAG: helix-turn-helix domain-containing protein [Polyangiales bacterium]
MAERQDEERKVHKAAQLKNLGAFIKRVRKERRITQDDLAKRLGVSKSQVSQIERGISWPSMPLYIAILDVLDLHRWDPTDPIHVVHELRRQRNLSQLGLADWILTLTEDEMRLFSTRGYEAVELSRALGVLHGKPLPSSGERLPLLFPDRLARFRSRAHSEED